MDKRAEAKALQRLFTAILVLATVGALAVLIYNITAGPPETLTEFYILDGEGRTADYPFQLKAGEEASLTLGIINREQATLSYRVEININGAPEDILGPITLAADEKHEQQVTFTLENPGQQQRIDFFLYKQGQDEVLESLYLLVNVTE
ncbi:MAG: DUF1616 domain-containing protein [Dehalococcoidales bacterium]|jgi:uncharacterized membrane protein